MILSIHIFKIPLLIIFAVPLCYAEENWTAIPGTDPANDTCLLTTPHLIMDDGQGQTTVWLEIGKQELVVKSKSSIDTAFNDVGIKVDQEAFIAFDEIRNETNVVFNKSNAEIFQQFIHGQKATVTLRFWPTWPTAGTKTIDFSLLGFTEASQKAGCEISVSKDTVKQEDKQ